MTRTLSTEIVSVNTSPEIRSLMNIRASHGEVIIDTRRPHNVMFRTDKSTYNAEFHPTFGDVTEVIDQIVDGLGRRFVVYPTIRLVADGFDFSEYGAIGFCAEVNHMMLLGVASNIVGGVELASSPVSSIDYRRVTKAKSFPVQEVVVTNAL